MDGNRVAPYPDVVPIHSDLSLEELRAQIEEHIKEDESITEWPDI